MTWVREIYRILPEALRAPLSRAFNWVDGTNISWSPYGEDLMVRGWLDEMKVPRQSIRYVDVGGWHPHRLSNTYLFYHMGGSGVIVEPSPDEAAYIQKRRPRDVVLPAGVAFDERRVASLRRFDPSVYNTFSEDHAAKLMREAPLAGLSVSFVGTTEVPLVPIMEIVERHFASAPCHLMSIDVEGVDSEILCSVDYEKFAPWFICCEYPNDTARAKLTAAGYSQRAQVPHSTIFALDLILPR